MLTPVCSEIRSVEGEKDTKDAHPPPRRRSNLCCSYALPLSPLRTSNPAYISFTNQGSTYLLRHNKSQLLSGITHLFRLFFPWRSRRRNTPPPPPHPLHADRECLCSITFRVPTHYLFTHRAENKTPSPSSLRQRKGKEPQSVFISSLHRVFFLPPTILRGNRRHQKVAFLRISSG